VNKVKDAAGDLCVRKSGRNRDNVGQGEVGHTTPRESLVKRQPVKFQQNPGLGKGKMEQSEI